MKTKISIIAFLSLLLLSSSRVFAQSQSVNPQQSILSVSPAIIETNIKKGSNQNYEITVKNLLKEPLGISSSVGGFQTQDEEEINPGQGTNDLSRFSTIEPSNAIIEPGQTKVFLLKIKIPNNLKDGGYYEAVLLTPFFSKPLSTSSPTVLTKAGILVLATNGQVNYQNLREKAKINSFNFVHLVNSNNQIDTVFKVGNTYFTHFDAKPFLTVSPLLGTSQKYELQDKKILPGKIRSWNESIRLSNSSIFNKATLAVSVGQGNYIYKNSYFFVLPVKLILVSLVLIAVAILLKLRSKQIRKALRVIGKGD